MTDHVLYSTTAATTTTKFLEIKKSNPVEKQATENSQNQNRIWQKP